MSIKDTQIFPVLIFSWKKLFVLKQKNLTVFKKQKLYFMCIVVKVSDLLELELQTVMSYHVDAEN